MRILMAIDSLRRGGRERRLIELLKEFKKQPWVEIQLVQFSEIIEYPEVHDLVHKLIILRRNPKKDPGVFLRFYSECKKFSPDIIHSWGNMASIYAIPSSLLMGIPLINGSIMDAPHNLQWYDQRLIRAKITYPFSSVVVGNSQAGLRAYKVPEPLRRCIYNGFDLNRIQMLDEPDKVRKRLNLPPGRVVGMVGGFYDRKDYVTFIEAAISILDEFADVSFLAVGSGPNLRRIREMIPRKYQNYILLPGQISSIESVINIFDLGVLTTNSHVHGEGISNAIIEYMILGKPVIATNGGGTPEIVDEGKSGYLIDPFDSSSLAEKIKYLLTHPEISANMGRNAVAQIKEKFLVDRMQKQYVDLYQELSPKDITTAPCMPS